jgi:hypothetical protein
VKRTARMCVLLLVVATPLAVSGPAHARAASPADASAARPAAACVTAQSDPRAPTVRSQLPAMQLASGLSGPDDIQVTGNVILVGELNGGRIARLGVPTAIGGFDHLPAAVPTVEGLVTIGTTQFAANQGADRIVTINGSQVTTFLQLRPVRGKLGVDGIGRVGNTLVVPDSPRGRVLFVGLDGRIQRTVRGFARPVNAWPLPNGAVLIPDENAAALVRINPDFSKTTVLSGLPLADDAVTDSTGAIFVDSLTRNSVVQVVNGAAVTLATGFGQGLATAPTVPAGQEVCVALNRAPGFTAPITIDPGTGYTVTAQPGTGSAGTVRPAACTGVCRFQVNVHSGTRTDAVWLQVRAG